MVKDIPINFHGIPLRVTGTLHTGPTGKRVFSPLAIKARAFLAGEYQQVPLDHLSLNLAALDWVAEAALAVITRQEASNA